MKKYLYLSAAALALASCSDEFIGEGAGSGTSESMDNAIVMGGSTAMMTRADHTGADAATLLNKNFVVEGIKGNGDYTGTLIQTEVFDHYNVNYAASTANTTESNTSDWEYVGKDAHSLSNLSSLSQKQTIKYWDFSAKQYDFVAFSYGLSNDENLTLSEIDYSKLGKAIYDADGNPVVANAVYSVKGSADDLSKAYIADLVTVYNHDNVNEFKSVITPKFRHLGTKVRVAFYETVPGYAVSNVKFYTAAWGGTSATADAGVTTPTIFAADAIFPSATTTGTMSVYYPTVGFDKRPGGTSENADYNQAHITFAAGTGTGEALATTKTFDALVYNATKESNERCTNIMGRTSTTATYAGAKTDENDHAYEMVLPLGKADNLQLRIEYDLYPIDGGEEVIHVRDARAVVPAAYADWKPNYAYTYIFKISDNTNGWTGVNGDGDVVEGITPITFDAVVVDTEDGVQETITTVATPSITTYQKGEVVTAGSEYVAGDVYASVMNGTTAVDLSSLTAPAGVAVYVATATDPSIITEALVQDQLNGTKHDTGITLASAGYELVSEVPAVDGNTLAVSACKFTVASGKTYVFQYTDGSKNYVKVIRVQ